jgi:hypothetical protein
MSIAMAAQTEYDEEEPAPVRAAAEELLPHREASIVPADSISGRALLAVIATHDIALMDDYDARRLVLHEGRLHVYD